MKPHSLQDVSGGFVILTNLLCIFLDGMSLNSKRYNVYANHCDFNNRLLLEQNNAKIAYTIWRIENNVLFLHLQLERCLFFGISARTRYIPQVALRPKHGE